MRGGDDLDDEFVAEGFEADVFSDDELGVMVGGEPSDSSDEWLGIQPTASAQNKKRKRNRGKEKKSKACAFSLGIRAFSLNNPPNSQKRKLAETTTSENVSTVTGDPAALADYLAGYQKKTYKQASELELADMRISGIASHMFEDTRPTDIHTKCTRICLD